MKIKHFSSDNFLDGKFQVRYKSITDVNGSYVNYQEFTKLLEQDNTVVIDVREEDEIRRTGSVPGSINIPCKWLLFIKYYL